MRPSIGRIVHYRLPSLIPSEPGEPLWRPAIVTVVWSETCVNLTVFTGGDYRGITQEPYRCTSVSEGEDVGQWRWPPRV